MKTLALALALAAALPAAAQSRREALDFLYRHMPHPDRAMHDSAFWGANVDASLRARAEMPWGAQVPMREWLHFVLPVRVNNEDLDLSRPLFYEELKERVKGKTMSEAILEVNHWCHEKVTYRASDARTSSPLSSVSQAIGRCGEESTFAVAGRSTHPAGRTPTTTTPGSRPGPTAGGTSWAPASPSPFSTSPGSTSPHRAA